MQKGLAKHLPSAVRAHVAAFQKQRMGSRLGFHLWSSEVTLCKIHNLSRPHWATQNSFDLHVYVNYKLVIAGPQMANLDKLHYNILH